MTCPPTTAMPITGLLRSPERPVSPTGLRRRRGDATVETSACPTTPQCLTASQGEDTNTFSDQRFHRKDRAPSRLPRAGTDVTPLPRTGIGSRIPTAPSLRYSAAQHHQRRRSRTGIPVLVSPLASTGIPVFYGETRCPGFIVAHLAEPPARLSLRVPRHRVATYTTSGPSSREPHRRTRGGADRVHGGSSACAGAWDSTTRQCCWPGDFARS
ncbi:hypothetical protein J2S53_003316 [Actinopolyspora lacussalsi]|nr:hypothetical protein [Actinopolyspora lacussalsi]